MEPVTPTYGFMITTGARFERLLRPLTLRPLLDQVRACPGRSLLATSHMTGRSYYYRATSFPRNPAWEILPW